jgi:hypothetical protein
VELVVNALRGEPVAGFFDGVAVGDAEYSDHFCIFGVLRRLAVPT